MADITITIDNEPVNIEVSEEIITIETCDCGGGGVNGYKVQADAADPTAGYLSEKVDGETLAVDETAHKIKIHDDYTAKIAANSLHSASDGKDHSDVLDNTADIALNTIHRGLLDNPHAVTAEQAAAVALSGLTEDWDAGNFYIKADSFDAPLFINTLGDLAINASNGNDIIIKLGDSGGTNKISFTDNAGTPAEVAYINSGGQIGVSDINIGADGTITGGGDLFVDATSFDLATDDTPFLPRHVSSPDAGDLTEGELCIGTGGGSFSIYVKQGGTLRFVTITDK
jgi:hypothetical protein